MLAETGSEETTVRRILKKDLKMKPYIPRMTQELFAEDFDSRMEFCEQWLESIAENPSFHEHVLWSDEAKFHLNGHVNHHNCSYWSDANPQITIDRPFQSPGIMHSFSRTAT